MATFQTTLRCFAGPDETAELVPVLRAARVRGIGWVLKWAAAIAVLCATIVILLNFGYRLAAERALDQAAAAGLRASALPRATSHTVEQSIRRELAGCFLLDRATQITIRCAGRPVKGIIAGSARDKLTMSLSAPVAAALPNWLQPLSPWNADAVIAAQVNRAG